MVESKQKILAVFLIGILFGIALSYGYLEFVGIEYCFEDYVAKMSRCILVRG